MTTTVSIGRNVGRDPMPREDWRAFCREVLAAVEDACGPIYFDGEGWGRSEEWGSEPAYTIVAGDPIPGAYLADALGHLGRKYGQDAVALTTGGDTSFV